MLSKLGWLLVAAGLVLMVAPGPIYDWLGHYAGMAGLLTLLVGISLLKIRKDQLAKR